MLFSTASNFHIFVSFCTCTVAKKELDDLERWKEEHRPGPVKLVPQKLGKTCKISYAVLQSFIFQDIFHFFSHATYQRDSVSIRVSMSLLFFVLFDGHGNEDVSETKQHRLSPKKSVRISSENLYYYLGKGGGLSLLLVTLSVVDVSEGVHTWN